MVTPLSFARICLIAELRQSLIERNDRVRALFQQIVDQSLLPRLQDFPSERNFSTSSVFFSTGIVLSILYFLCSFGTAALALLCVRFLGASFAAHLASTVVTKRTP
jgi:hypothetical protein